MLASESGFYNNGKGTEAQPCRYSLGEDFLYIYLTESASDLVLWKLYRIKASVSDSESFLFSYENSSTLIGKGPLASGLYQTLKSGIDLKEKHQGKLSTRSLYMILGITFCTVIVALLVYLFVLPWAAEKATVLVPVNAEMALGEKLAEVYTSETKTLDSVNYYLEKFVNLLKLDSVYPIQVKLIVSDEINAFALPGGKIYIYSALLEKIRSPEELVALLGHEVTHVSKRHSLKSISRSMASGILLGLVFGDASGLISRADEFKQLDYSRELETEADINGLSIMVQNRVDPGGMLKLLQILKDESDKAPHYMHYLSTHPDAMARILSIKEQAASRLHFGQNLDLRAVYEKIKLHLVK